MTNTVVARRYAGALFALSRKEGKEALAGHGQTLSELRDMAAMQPRLGQMLKSPVISVEEKKAVIGRLLEKIGADRTMCNFCFLLADKERLACLAEIADWYGILLDEANGVLRGRVTTAIMLTPEKRREIKDSLEKKLGSDIELAFDVDPEILGGMVLAVGDRVLDSSLRAQLGILRETLKKGA